MNRLIFLIPACLLYLILSAGCSGPSEEELRAQREAAMRVQLQEANNLLASGATDEAILLLEIARSDFQSEADVLESLAFAYQTAGQHDLAGDLFEQALLVDPTRSELAIFAAHSFLQAGETEAAIRMYTTHLQHDDSDAFAWRSLAQLYYQENRLRPALDAYLEAVRADDSGEPDAETTLAISRLYLALGNVPQARDWMHKAEQRSGTSSAADLELQRFDLALREQNWNEAIRIMAELEKNHPAEFSNSSLYANREPLQQWLNNQQRLQQVRISPTQAAADSEEQPPAEQPPANATTSAEEPTEVAETSFPPKIPVDPLPPATTPPVVTTEAAEEAAAPAFTKIPAINTEATVAVPSLPKIPLIATEAEADPVPAAPLVAAPLPRPGLIGEADARRDEGNYTDAMQLYLRAAGQNDRIATPWYEISRIYALQGKYQEAELTALEAIRRDPQDPTLSLNLLNVLQSSASPQRFMREVIRARERHPDTPEIIFAAARAYEHIGNSPRNARFLYQDFLNKTPDSHPKRPDAEQALQRLLTMP